MILAKSASERKNDIDFTHDSKLEGNINSHCESNNSIKLPLGV